MSSDPLALEPLAEPELAALVGDFRLGVRARWAVVRGLLDAAGAEGAAPRTITAACPDGELAADIHAVDAVTWCGLRDPPETPRLAALMPRLLEHYAGAPVETAIRRSRCGRFAGIVYTVGRAGVPLDDAERDARATEWRCARAMLDDLFLAFCGLGVPKNTAVHKMPAALLERVCARVSELATAVVSQYACRDNAPLRAEFSVTFELGPGAPPADAGPEAEPARAAQHTLAFHCSLEYHRA